jgi:hypothetical protein
MTGRIVRLLLVAGSFALGFWGWRFLHRSPERVIRRELAELARTACIPANEGNLPRLANAQKLASFFTTDVEIDFDLRGRFSQTISGRSELQEKALAARAALSGLTVEFLDINVTVAPDGQSATADLTAKASLPGDTVPQVEEVKVDFKKVDGDWLIQHAENVKTLR